MNIDEITRIAREAGFVGFDGKNKTLAKFAALVAAQEREAIMKSIEELRPVEDNPLLQNKPAAFWIENFRQIIYARSKA